MRWRGGKIWWERDKHGKLCFVTAPHGCGNCFRPCVYEGEWRILSSKEVPQTSAPTANKWIKERTAS